MGPFFCLICTLKSLRAYITIKIENGYYPFGKGDDHNRK